MQAPIYDARHLRTESTDAERRVWWLLRNRRLLGCKFRRQHPIGPFFVDFACVERRLIIELDGGQHTERAQYDSQRTSWLESRGWRVLRFWNDDVLLRPDDALEAIVSVLVCAPHPGLRPAGGERESCI
ncbi:MAG TPA: endonuclease domain-containing protein [Casimicrobiaceae bacterium]|nr:endonuclease domain-containing protein [Casimicrobiaceae bacterium]